FCEEFYNRAREEFQVRFIKSNISTIIKSDTTNELLIRGENILDDHLFENPTDLVVLAVGIEPAEGTEELAQILNISTDTYGFLLESHLKVRPSDSSVKGIYIAGAIQFPKDIPNSISQAESTASKTISLLTKGEIELDPLVVRYNRDLCDLCRLCENVCGFNAIEIKGDKLTIINANCVGCGACAAMCPKNALTVPGFTKEEIIKQLKVITDKKKESPLIVTFLCNWCSYLGADLAGTSKIQYPTNTRPIHVMCTAMIDPALVFEALFNGADGVLIAGCHPQDCHYKTGFIKAENRYESIISMLEELKINNNRVKIISISAGEGQKFANTIREFTETLKTLGPISKDLKYVKKI
ncbi:MAG: hydrogenase iron-sulfur subunit, partial [Candidatus Lokiarchaeota archaeon]|nr:hydrogenase iron-sulfur subunit [Candidatus Lokiarchaeota archaeon]